jgi:hypothetical protein
MSIEPGWHVKKRRARNVVRVRVPEQAPVFHVPGEHGGWFISLLYGHGTAVDVSMDEMRKLLAGSRGTVIVARRLVGADLRLFELYRGDSDGEVHGTIINKEELRFRRERRRR